MGRVGGKEQGRRCDERAGSKRRIECAVATTEQRGETLRLATEQAYRWLLGELGDVRRR